MPLTHIDFPILQSFFCSVEARTGMPPQPLDASPEQAARAGRTDELQQRDASGDGDKPLPKGVVLGPDGKPYVHPILKRRCGRGENVLTRHPAVKPAPPPPRGKR